MLLLELFIPVQSHKSMPGGMTVLYSIDCIDGSYSATECIAMRDILSFFPNFFLREAIFQEVFHWMFGKGHTNSLQITFHYLFLLFLQIIVTYAY